MMQCKKCKVTVTDEDYEAAKFCGDWCDDNGDPTHDNCGCNKWEGQEGAEDPFCVCEFKKVIENG